MTRSPTGSPGEWGGKVVLVTGAASGIGRAVVLAAAAAGASVVLAVRRPETALEVVKQAQQAARSASGHDNDDHAGRNEAGERGAVGDAADRGAVGGRGSGGGDRGLGDTGGRGGEGGGGERGRGRGAGLAVVPCDLTVPGAAGAAVGEAVDRFGRLDAVVHSATSNASSQPVALEDVDLADWDEHRTIAVDAAVELARAAHEPLKAARGSMLLLTSPAGIAGSDRLPFYAMAKGAQRALVKALAREWGPDGIRVNALAPLAMSPAMRSAFAADPGLEQDLAGSIPLGWFGDAERDIAPVVLFLCSDGARYVTGQTLVVNGGRYTSL